VLFSKRQRISGLVYNVLSLPAGLRFFLGKRALARQDFNWVIDNIPATGQTQVLRAMLFYQLGEVMAADEPSLRSPCGSVLLLCEGKSGVNAPKSICDCRSEFFRQTLFTGNA
jgi:hypothetical protein